MKCSKTRWYLANRTDSCAEPRIQSHVNECDGCSEFQQKLSELDRNLRSSAQYAPLPVFEAKKAGWWNLRVFAVVGAPVLFAMAALLWLNKGQNSETPMIVDAVSVTQVEHPSSKVSAGPAPRVFIQSKLTELVALADANPMEAELRALREDGKRGIDYLRAFAR